MTHYFIQSFRWYLPSTSDSYYGIVCWRE